MKNSKLTILALETSCDETACAIVEAPFRQGFGGVKVLANVVASSEEMHKKTGGIVPEVAAREQLSSIIPVVDTAMKNAELKIENVDAVAVTVGPGLVGSLLVGVETAKALAYVWEKPIIPVNHLVAHLYANYVSLNSKFQIPIFKQNQNSNFQTPKLPAIGLVVSGGHTDLVSIEVQENKMRKSIKIKWLGGTRDDAAGECLDKCARLLGLPYPGGPAIAAEAANFLKRSDHVDKQQGPTLPRPLMHEDTWDFSFSGLKTALRRTSTTLSVNAQGKPYSVSMLAFEVQEAIVEVLVSKLERAVKEFRPKSVLLGGGVAANSRLRESLNAKCKMLKANLFVPPKELCTDNAVMIGAAALRLATLAQGKLGISWKKVQVEPGMEIG